MKLLVFMLALLLLVPTVQGGCCGMGDSQEMAETPSSEGHDCCPGADKQEAEDEPPCDDDSHCSGCLISMSAVPASVLLIQHKSPETRFSMAIPGTAPSYSLPPFRPPIS